MLQKWWKSHWGIPRLFCGLPKHPIRMFREDRVRSSNQYSVCLFKTKYYRGKMKQRWFLWRTDLEPSHCYHLEQNKIERLQKFWKQTLWKTWDGRNLSVSTFFVAALLYLAWIWVQHAFYWPWTTNIIWRWRQKSPCTNEGIHKIGYTDKSITLRTIADIWSKVGVLWRCVADLKSTATPLKV